MSDGDASDDSGRQKRTRLATPAAPSEEKLRQTRRSPIATDRNHVNSHFVTLHDKLAKIVVRCAADFMTRRQNLHYNISSQYKLKSEDEYVPNYNHIKSELDVEKGTKEGGSFQSLIEKHSIIIAECQLKLNSLVIEAGDLDLVKNKKLAIISFVELVHKITEGFLTHNDRKYIDSHQCSINVIKFYSDHIAVHLDTSKERLLEEYQNNYKLE